MTNSSCALVVIFNHRFEKNITKLDAIYSSRFSEIRYLMPFSSSKSDSRVVNIFETSWNFSGHIAQAHLELESLSGTHVAFVADDLVLNPGINEHNLVRKLNLDETAGYLKNIAVLDGLRYRWHRALQECVNFRRASRGFDYLAELPSVDEARRILEGHGLCLERSSGHAWSKRWHELLDVVRSIGWSNLIWFPFMFGKSTSYPLVSGYSDFIVVPKANLASFVRYCGVFAALNVFAEIAVPTALALAVPNLQTELPMGFHFTDQNPSHPPLEGVEFWSEAEARSFAEQMGHSLSVLMSAFPKTALYVHPVKLSAFSP